jgi:hypothetical protein
MRLPIRKIKFEEGEEKGKLRSLGFRYPHESIPGPPHGFGINTIWIGDEKKALIIADLLKTRSGGAYDEDEIKKQPRAAKTRKRRSKTIDEILGNIEGDNADTEADADDELRNNRVVPISDSPETLF